jgi:hypothetical protein
MQKRWQRYWESYEKSVITEAELFSWFLDNFDEARTTQEVAELPPHCRDWLTAYVRSHHPYEPTGFLIGVLSPEQREQLRLERKHRYAQLVKALGLAAAT